MKPANIKSFIVLNSDVSWVNLFQIGGVVRVFPVDMATVNTNKKMISAKTYTLLTLRKGEFIAMHLTTPKVAVRLAAQQNIEPNKILTSPFG